MTADAYPGYGLAVVRSTDVDSADLDTRGTTAHLTDDAGGTIARVADPVENGLGTAWRAGNEETSRGLWIGEDLAQPQLSVVRKGNRRAVAVPVSPRSTGDEALLG